MRTTTLVRRSPRDLAATRLLQFNDGSATPIALPENIADATDVVLSTVVADATEALKTLAAKDTPSDADVAEGQRLASVIAGGKTELAKRETAAAASTAEASTRKGALGDLLSGAEAPVVVEAAVEAPAPAKVEAPAAPAEAPAEAVVAAAAPSAGEVRGAGGGSEVVARRATMALVAAPDAPGVAQGHAYGDFTEAATGILERTSLYPGAPSAGAARQVFRNGALRLSRSFESGLVAAGYDADEAIEYATSFDRIGGQDALLADGGWGAASETLYDLVELEATDGMLDVPEIQMVRGGVRFTRGPEFSSFRGRGFFQTEAQAIAGTAKPFYRVPGADFVEERAGVAGIAVTSGILQNKAYPELVARVLRGLLAGHAHDVNGRTISDIAAGSTAVTMTGGAGAFVPLLSAMELQATDVRTKHSMADSAVLETVLPSWIIGVLRQDLASRHGVSAERLPDNAITQHFADRKVRVQFVQDWQVSALGQAAAATAWPATVQFVMYPAGTWVRAMGDVISIDTLYDSAGLGQNDYTALFSEEQYLVVRKGHESRRVTVPIAANGSVSAVQLVDNIETANV